MLVFLVQDRELDQGRHDIWRGSRMLHCISGAYKKGEKWLVNVETIVGNSFVLFMFIQHEAFGV